MNLFIPLKKNGFGLKYNITMTFYTAGQNNNVFSNSEINR